jgi:hypothetical protein
MNKFYNELCRIYGNIWIIQNNQYGNDGIIIIKNNEYITKKYDLTLQFKICNHNYKFKISDYDEWKKPYSVLIYNSPYINHQLYFNNPIPKIFNDEIHQTQKLSIEKFLLYDKIDFVIDSHILGLKFDIGQIIFRYYLYIYFIIDL